MEFLNNSVSMQDSNGCITMALRPAYGNENSMYNEKYGGERQSVQPNRFSWHSKVHIRILISKMKQCLLGTNF